MTNDEFQAPCGAAVRLLRSAGLGGGSSASLHPLRSGGNNRVFKLLPAPGAPPCLLKQYFHHPGDTRDRLGHEYGFLRFLWSRGERRVPEPLAADPDARLGLYEFVSGEPPSPGSVTPERVLAFADFFREVNQWRLDPDARRLPLAAEACVSMDAHLRSAAWRLEQLAAIPGEADGVAREARLFIRGALLPAWERLQASLRENDARLHPAELPRDAWCLSPSDFGFHNALVRPGGALAFLDFEYAGWDDPAKLLCDFFAHPGHNVPFALFDAFADAALRGFPSSAACKRRALALTPLHRLKWICIILNEFLPVSSRRRIFAAGREDLEEARRAQLQKALLRLDTLWAGLEPPRGPRAPGRAS